MGITHDSVIPAVHHQHRNCNSRQPVYSVVFDGAEQTHWKPRKELRRHVRDAGEGALQNESSQRLMHGQIGGNAATKGFAQTDDLRRGKSFLPQPMIRGLGIQVRSRFSRPPFALPIPAVIEEKHIQAQLEPGAAEIQPMADVAGIAVQEQKHKPAPRLFFACRKKPAMKPHAVARG